MATLRRSSHSLLMADISCVKVVEVCRVAPPPESALPMSLPLTFFDIFWLRFPPVKRLFFYETSVSFFDVILPNLKISLSVILQHYLPLVGNLVWPPDSHKPVVESVEGDGVLLIVAESNADFYHLSGDGLREAAGFRPLEPELPASDESAAVVALQVTSFQNVGFCVGISCHHAILDGRTSTSFLKSWARICNLNIAGKSYFPATEPIPFYDRTIVEDPQGLEAIYLKDWLNVGGPNKRSLKVWPVETPPDLIRGTFKLTRENLKRLKQWVLKHRKQNQPPIHISTFTVATAYTWVCKARVEELRDSKSTEQFAMSVDARARLDPPLPTNYFGNCVVGRFTNKVEKHELLGENGFIAAVEAISEAIKCLEDGLLAGAESWVRMLLDIKSEDMQPLSTAGSPRFEVYSVDFGWGKPKKVEMISIDATGAVSLSDSRDGEGLELGWVAKRSIMESFATHFAKGLEEL